jgi:hypothetical protein
MPIKHQITSLRLASPDTLRIPAIVTAHSKFIVTDKLLMLEG